MTTDRTYRCNLCGDYIEPTQGSSKPGFGVFISGDGRAFKRVHETERHICHQCARNVHDEWRKVTPAPPPAPEGETMNVFEAMDVRDAAHRETLERIGQEIGYGRAQQLLGELWDAMLDREYPPPDGVSRSSRGRMGVTANLHVGDVVIGPSPLDGKEGWTMVQWIKDRGCPPVGTRLYAEQLHPANP